MNYNSFSFVLSSYFFVFLSKRFDCPTQLSVKMIFINIA